MAAPSQLLAEIDEQPRVLTRLLSDGTAAVREAAERIRAYNPQYVIIAARGTSDNAARYAQYLFGAHNQWATALAIPSLHTVYRSPPNMKGALDRKSVV